MTADHDAAPLSARGPEAILEWIAGADIVDGHWRLLDRCAAILNAAGFTITPVAHEALEADFPGTLVGYARQASSQWCHALDTKTECALGVLNALAALYAVQAGSPPFASGNHDRRVMLAGTMLGIQTALLEGSESGLIEDAAIHQIRTEQAREFGRASGDARRNPHRERARAAWLAYSGNSSKTRWAEKHCAEYEVSKSTLLDWLRDIKKTSG
ncbi:MAG: hypothetical protein AB7O98_15465 [Hyphomonadaceae bacterium]